MILSEERKRQIEELHRLGEERGFTIAYQEEQKKSQTKYAARKGLRLLMKDMIELSTTGRCKILLPPRVQTRLTNLLQMDALAERARKQIFYKAGP
jgi:DNA invertase Pin-like site-specific DNA recombinase